jgi:hypothetical protein
MKTVSTAVVAFEDLRLHLLGRSDLDIRICYLNNVVRARENLPRLE